MIQRLRSLVRIAQSERSLALRALGALAGVRLALWLLPFARLRRLVEYLGVAAPMPTGSSDTIRALAVRRAVTRAARTIPGSACLAQALTAELLLRRLGLPVRASIGVALDGKPLDAHAWVESAGVLVTGDSEDLGAYRTLVVFDTEVHR